MRVVELPIGQRQENDTVDIPPTPDYVAQVREHLERMNRQPWDHHQRKGGAARLAERLESERNALLALRDERKPVLLPHLLVHLSPAATPDHMNALQATLLSWHAQSHPLARCTVIIPGDTASGQAVELRKLVQQIGVHAAVQPLDAAWWEARESNEFLISAQCGDQLHPALATCLALRQSDDTTSALAWSWNRIRAGYKSGRLGADKYLRSPGASPLTLLGAVYTGRAISISARWLATARPEIRHALALGNLQPAVLSLAATEPERWLHHPEYLSLTSEPDVAPLNASDATTSAYQDLTRSLGFSPWLTSGLSSPQPMQQPQLQCEGISVVIPFRDHADNTLKSVAAVAAQVTDTWIEVILVNNQSSAQSIATIEAALQDNRYNNEHCTTRIIDYPHGFSHSRQCNIAAENARGDVVVILNNDAFLINPDCLDQMARWSQLPGIGTVGIRVCSDTGQTVCAGLRAKLRTGMDFESPIEEGTDTILADGIKEVAGNTGACFAMMRSRFLETGGFNTRVFPIGYNDVEFCLRTSALGLRHLYLGWLQVEHKPGSSRGPTDEVMQILCARADYPSVFRQAQFQLGEDLFYRTISRPGKKTRKKQPRAARLRAALRHVPGFGLARQIVHRLRNT